MTDFQGTLAGPKGIITPTILGHANIATTSRYLHSNAARMREMVEEL